MVDILSQESGKEVQEEEDMCTIMAHSYCCMAETITTL